jgi:hypothetical protein
MLGKTTEEYFVFCKKYLTKSQFEINWMNKHSRLDLERPMISYKTDSNNLDAVQDGKLWSNGQPLESLLH